MDKTQGMPWRDKECVPHSVREREEEIPPVRRRHRWEVNVKIDFKGKCTDM